MASGRALAATNGHTPDAMSVFAKTIVDSKYAHDKGGGNKETWEEIAVRQGMTVVRPYLPELVDKVTAAIAARKFIPGGRYLYAAGRPYPQISNCFLFRAHDSREGWGELIGQVTNSLMTGGGIGVVYSDLRSEGSPVRKMGGKSTGPCALMRMINEAGRYIMQGGSRRSALWAGLHWNHPDALKFATLKQWSPLIHQCRREDYSFPAPMDGTNISMILDDEFFLAHNDPGHRDHAQAQAVYWICVRGMLKDGEPGFSVDIGENSGSNCRNACTEIDSPDNLDNCNLGSLNMARISSPEEFYELVNLGTAFLLCGSLYGVLPVQAMHAVREKNRRIGLGLMGIHEWLLSRGYRYGMCDELREWMSVYRMSGALANKWADRLGTSRPVATRSIAPTGTISIAAETTSGIEPIFAAGYKRRYLDGSDWKYQYVVDATARRLIDGGVDPALVEDAYTLAEDPVRRIQFQVDMQKSVDHAISSTINLPEWGSSINNESTVDSFGKLLYRLLPGVRGFTAYPNGGRGGQPLNRVPYSEAVKYLGHEYSEGGDGAVGGVTGGAVVEETGDKSCTGGFCNS